MVLALADGVIILLLGVCPSTGAHCCRRNLMLSRCVTRAASAASSRAWNSSVLLC